MLNNFENIVSASNSPVSIGVGVGVVCGNGLFLAYFRIISTISSFWHSYAFLAKADYFPG
jgi:hypothetical protein